MRKMTNTEALEALNDVRAEIYNPTIGLLYTICEALETRLSIEYSNGWFTSLDGENPRRDPLMTGYTVEVGGTTFYNEHEQQIHYEWLKDAVADGYTLLIDLVEEKATNEDT